MAQPPDERILMGTVSTDSLKRDTSLHWLHDATSYQPNADALAKLALHKDKLFVQVFCGSWCEDTHRELPRFLQIAAASGIKYSLYFVDRNKQSTAGDEKKYNILFIPTSIVLYDGKETGRIVDMAPKGIENHLTELLK